MNDPLGLFKITKDNNQGKNADFRLFKPNYDLSYDEDIIVEVVEVTTFFLKKKVAASKEVSTIL